MTRLPPLYVVRCRNRLLHTASLSADAFLMPESARSLVTYLDRTLACAPHSIVTYRPPRPRRRSRGPVHCDHAYVPPHRRRDYELRPCRSCGRKVYVRRRRAR